MSGAMFEERFMLVGENGCFESDQAQRGGVGQIPGSIDGFLGTP